MFGSKILEVVIGIIFVFLLYSLMVTAIQELISSFLFLRARLLQKAIRRMLIDDRTIKYKNGNNSYFKRLVLRIENYLAFFIPCMIRLWKKEVNFSTFFYDQPGIKYLGISNWYKRPSYIKPETFAKTIYDILTNNNDQDLDDPSKINMALLNNNFLHNEITYSIDPETLLYIKSLWKDSSQNVDIFKQSLINWYNESMERLTGSYKRSTQLYVFVIGILTAFIFNVDTIKITDKLSKDDNARTELTKLASTYLENHDINNLVDTVKRKGENNENSIDTLSREVNKVFAMLKEDINQPNNLIAIGWKIPDDFDKSILIDSLLSIETAKNKIAKLSLCEECMQRIFINRLNKLEKSENQKTKETYLRIIKPIISIDTIEEKNISKIKTIFNTKTSLKNGIKLNIFEKIKYVICFAFSDFRTLIGLLITAIAISIGAPFWFDLLNKFINIRGTGSKQIS
jgi:hypothetical protein